MSSYKKFTKLCKEGNAQVNKGFTNWLSKIRCAEIVLLKELDDFENNENVIQVKQMRKFKSHEYAIMEKSQHCFDRALDVIKLPMELPYTNRDAYPLSEYMFVRPDDYELFRQCGGKKDHIILIGNSGISKSWFHWKFILFCFRLDLYQLLYGNKEIWTENERQASDMESAKRLKLSAVDFHIPKYILQTSGDQTSYMFFVEKPETNVLSLDISKNRFKSDEFETKDLTILWRPTANYRILSGCRNQTRVVGTMPTYKPGYKYDYKHGAAMFYMPCPSELHLQWMSKIVNQYAIQSKHKASVMDIHKRIKVFGPCIRTVLFQYDNYGYHRKDLRYIQKVLAEQKLSSIDSKVQMNKEFDTLSEDACQYTVDRDHPKPYQYFSQNFKINNSKIRAMHRQHVKTFPFSKLHQRLIDPENDQRKGRYTIYDDSNYGIEDCYNTNLAALFANFSQSLFWKCRLLSHPHQTSTIEWQDFKVHFQHVHHDNTVQYSDMQEGILYQPNDVDFPLVHFYYLQGSRLVGIIANVSANLSRSVYDHLHFYHNLGISPASIPLDIYYITPPLRKTFYDTPEAFTPNSFFIEANEYYNVCDESANLSLLQASTSFSILHPPDDFSASFDA